MTDLIEQGRKLIAEADGVFLDKIAAHDCGVSQVALLAIESLREALRVMDEARESLRTDREASHVVIAGLREQVTKLEGALYP